MRGETRIQLPIVVGHETPGVIEEIGPGVKRDDGCANLIKIFGNKR